jgi:hypothetical protein
MKGQDPKQVSHALRQGQMAADFLILLVNRTNWVILENGQVRWLRIALLYERLHNVGLSDDEGRELNEWAISLRTFAAELFSFQAATTLIQDKYFDGECILLKDAVAELEQQTTTVQTLIAAFDNAVIKAGQPEFVTNTDKLREAVRERASERAGYIAALAKSKMLDDFGEPDAADAVIKPYFLRGLGE